jgi:pyruvate/2-oxoglutarate dehydrogenase complex dihydrolipoamide dehydrogenase (E3) component
MVAVGGKISKPPIPGIEKAYTYEEVLDGRVDLKDKKVAVIGGGLTGLETAEYLSQNNKVSVIEMLGAVGTTNYHSVTTAITTAIKENGGEIRTNTALKAIGEGKEVLFTVMPSAFEKKEEFDAVVLAMGTQSRADFADAYEAEFDKVSVIGEAIETGNIADATHTGYNKAFVF